MEFGSAQSLRLVVAGFDVRFEIDVPSQRVMTHHTDRGFVGRGTAPNGLGHDETVLWVRDYETAVFRAPENLRISCTRFSSIDVSLGPMVFWKLLAEMICPCL